MRTYGVFKYRDLGWETSKYSRTGPALDLRVVLAPYILSTELKITFAVEISGVYAKFTNSEVSILEPNIIVRGVKFHIQITYLMLLT